MAPDPADQSSPLTERIKNALESADLDAMRELLAPDVTWGAPGDPNPACRNRDQVLTWYQRGRNAGARASVVEMEVRGGGVSWGCEWETPRQARSTAGRS